MNAANTLKNNKALNLKELDRCAIIIQARMLSRRFPGKMMSLLSGMPLVEYVYKRCKMSPVNKVLIITSADKSDDALYSHCKKNKISVMRGSLNNVLQRYIQAGDSAGVDYIVRVCGDTPFVDISLIEALLERLIREKLDYVSFNRKTCAPGFHSEVIALRALKKAAKLTDLKENLEHVTRFIINEKDKFSTRFMDVDLNPGFAGQARLTIDYPEDIETANAVIDELEDKISFTSKEILSILRKKETVMKSDFPQRIEIELAGACNLKCTFCPRKYMNGLNGFMAIALFKKLIDEIAQYPETILVLHRRGESLLHPDFIEICGYVRGKFKEIQLATNATLLDDAKSKAIIDAIHFISFSIDIPEAFDKIRVPAKYDAVEAKILRFLDLNNKRVQTQVSMVETSQTPSRNAEIFKKIWRGKVDRIRIYEEHSRDGKFGSLMRPRARRLPCVMPFYEMLIYYDGKVGRCNHDWNGKPLGDVNTDTIRDIWQSDIYNDLRKQARTLRIIKDKVCKNCQSWYPEIGKQGTGETLE